MTCIIPDQHGNCCCIRCMPVSTYEMDQARRAAQARVKAVPAGETDMRRWTQRQPAKRIRFHLTVALIWAAKITCNCGDCYDALVDARKGEHKF